MIKKLLIVSVLVMVASLSVAGCISTTSTNQAATNTSKAPSTARVATKAAASDTTIYQSTPTSTPSLHPTATASSKSYGGGSAGLTVLFFYKPKCPYCQALEPQVTQLQNTYAGKASVQWIVSTESPLTDQYGVTGVPTLILLNNGNEAGRWVDPGNTGGLSAQIDSLLGTR
ncbi:MAG: thioredoxin family protein [Halobacteriota archaeon]